LPDGRIYWSPTIKKEKTLRKEDRAMGGGPLGLLSGQFLS